MLAWGLRPQPCPLGVRVPPLVAPRVGSAGSRARVSETPARVVAPCSSSAAATCPSTPPPAPTAAQLYWSWGPERLPPTAGRRRAPPRHPRSETPLRSRDGKSWRRRRLLSPAERARSSLARGSRSSRYRVPVAAAPAGSCGTGVPTPEIPSSVAARMGS